MNKIQSTGFLYEKKNDIITKFILFLLSPFLAFIYSLKRINTKSSFFIFFLFSLCFGMCFTPEKSIIYIDGQHYQEIFLHYRQITETTFENNFKEYIAFDSDTKDYYADTLSYYVSKITDNYHVFFLAASLIFSFFLLNTLKYLTKEKEFDNSYTCLLLCYLFVNISIFNINGLRFWTGYWVAMFALFKIFRDNNYKYLILLLVATFCHGSLWILIPLVLVAFFTKKYTKIWIILYIVSFFIGQIAFSIIGDITDYLPIFMQKFINNYTSSEAIKRVTTEGTGFWIVGKAFEYVVDVFFLIVMLIIIVNNKQVINDKRTINIYGLLLVLITFSNFVSSVPSLGNRFSMFTYPLIAYIWLLHIKDYKKQYSLFFMLMPLYFFMNIFQTLKLYVNTLNIDFFIASPIYLIYKYLA